MNEKKIKKINNNNNNNNKLYTLYISADALARRLPALEKDIFYF